MSRTNITDLNSRTGSVCCETIPDISISCRAACRSALYSPTLSESKKLNRIHTICDKSETEADSVKSFTTFSFKIKNFKNL